MRDLIVIGGGPGGYAAAIRARQLGLEVTLIERKGFGGTCLHCGCIPTKVYYRSAEVMDILDGLESFGIEGTGAFSISLSKVYKRKKATVKKLALGIEQILRSLKVEIIAGEAKVLSPGLVQVGSQILTTKNILLATGSQNMRLAVGSEDNPRILDSTALLELQTLPGSLAVIGGGVIGMEFASIFRSFGCKVTVIEAETVLNGLDTELVKRYMILAKKQGINIIAPAQAQSILPVDGGVKIEYRTSRGEGEISAEYVLTAIGRRPVLNGIEAEKLGLRLDEQGFIQIDEHMATNIPGIYAIGDVVGGHMLAHVASAEGVAAAETMAGYKTAVPYHAVPSCIFAFPEIATVGKTEQEARQQGIAYVKGKFNYAANGKAMCLVETDGFIKVLADSNQVVIGVHILGAHASDLILEGALLVKERMKLDQATSTIHPHPVLGEILHEALLDAKGQSIHKVN